MSPNPLPGSEASLARSREERRAAALRAWATRRARYGPTLPERAAAAGIPYLTVWGRLRRGWSPEAALTTPPRTLRKRR